VGDWRAVWFHLRAAATCRSTRKAQLHTDNSYTGQRPLLPSLLAVLDLTGLGRNRCWRLGT